MVLPSMNFPFPAIIGQEALKLCLMLAAVDWRLSCLIRGDKGSGKSTAARAVAEILPGTPPFVNVPIGVTDDRLLGGLSLEAAFQGSAALKPGLVHQAHGGVLYIDEVNLLAGHLTDALLDVSATGRYVLERDGFSQSHDAQFILMGSMNLEEGSLRPQLLDRFALAVDVHAPLTALERVKILQVRRQFDENPQAFLDTAKPEQSRLRQIIASARQRLHAVALDNAVLMSMAEKITAAGVRSLRADLAAIRGCVALAALEERDVVTGEDVDRVLPLVLLHRATRPHDSQAQPPAAPPAEQSDGANRKQQPDGARVFTPETRSTPRLYAVLAGGTAESPKPPGTPDPGRVDVFASLQSSARNTGAVALRPDYITHPKSQMRAGTRYVFVVDCSGSQAAKQRMRAVKGVALALIRQSFIDGDEVAVISFRGAHAGVIVEPSRDIGYIERQLEVVPTGGRTPLAHALKLASEYLIETACLILLTDGRANVPLHNGDPWEDALVVAREVRCPSIVLDTSTDDSPQLAELTKALRAQQRRLDELGEAGLLTVVRQ